MYSYVIKTAPSCSSHPYVEIAMPSLSLHNNACMLPCRWVLQATIRYSSNHITNTMILQLHTYHSYSYDEQSTWQQLIAWLQHNLAALHAPPSQGAKPEGAYPKAQATQQIDGTLLCFLCYTRMHVHRQLVWWCIMCCSYQPCLGSTSNACICSGCRSTPTMSLLNCGTQR